jgi:hypothetical protein
LGNLITFVVFCYRLLSFVVFCPVALAAERLKLPRCGLLALSETGKQFGTARRSTGVHIRDRTRMKQLHQSNFPFLLLKGLVLRQAIQRKRERILSPMYALPSQKIFAENRHPFAV